MKKICITLFFIMFLLFTLDLSAFEMSLRTGGSIGIRNWSMDQMKIGLNFAFIGEDDEEGFFFSSSIDAGFLDSATTIWITPELEYHVKLGSSIFRFYPKLGLTGVFGIFPEDTLLMGFGVKPTLGFRADVSSRVFLYLDALSMNILFLRHFDYPAGLLALVNPAFNIEVNG